MSDMIVFDTDCISSFLWINSVGLVVKLYKGNIIIPKQVYKELSNKRISGLRKKLDKLLKKDYAKLKSIDIRTVEYEEYLGLTTNIFSNDIIIGKGEAEALLLSKKYEGILASNNLKDISNYTEKMGVRYITTADILKEAYFKEIISLEIANDMWEDMIKKRRKLGANSFSEYIKK